MRDTRAALIAAAIATLRESGFAAASARRIADRGRMQPGADLLPLRLGPRPAGSRARGRQRAADGRLPRAARPHRHAGRAHRRRPGGLRGRPRRRPCHRAGRDDQRGAVGAGARRAGQRLPGARGARSPRRRCGTCWPRRRSVAGAARRGRARRGGGHARAGDAGQPRRRPGQRPRPVRPRPRGRRPARPDPPAGGPAQPVTPCSPAPPAPPARPEALCRPTW